VSAFDVFPAKQIELRNVTLTSFKIQPKQPLMSPLVANPAGWLCPLCCIQQTKETNKT
jgi:hypothetical protein